MIYNSNGNNVPYHNGGNAKVNKQLKELEEAIESVNDGFNDFLSKIDLYTGEDFIHGYSGANRFTDNTNRVKALEATVNGTQGTKSLDQKILDVDAKVTALGTEINTGDVNATNGDFHKVVAGKYVFQNGYSITGTNICKINNGSVVYATDGTNSVLIDYTDKDAWVAKAKVEDGEHFSIYSNGVLTCTLASNWSVYVIGNDFDTDDLSIPQVMLLRLALGAPSYVDEIPENIETGVTIGGNLYAALGREYDFDSITSDEASIRIATITGNISAPNADINEINSGGITVADLIATNANIESLNNSERNFTGYVDVPTHATNINEYIKLNRFTGTYNLKLVKNINGANETLFTATVIWNGQYPVVDYHENQNLLDRDYLYSFVLTDQGLYFVTQGDGKLYYGWDSFDAIEPESSVSIDSNETVIVEYETVYADRTVFFGDHTQLTGVDILGQINADIIHLPDSFSIENLDVDGDLNVDGDATLVDLTATNVMAEKVDSDELIGKSLTIKDGNSTYVTADEEGVAINSSVTVSEKETINELEPEANGYYVDHDAYKVGDTYLTLTQNTRYNYFKYSELPSEPVSQELLVDNVYLWNFPDQSITTRVLRTYTQTQSNVNNWKLRLNGKIYNHVNGNYYDNDSQDTLNPLGYWGAAINYYLVYFPTASDTGLQQNKVYYKWINGSNVSYDYYTGDTASTDCSPEEVAILNQKTFSEAERCLHIGRIYKGVSLSGSTVTYVSVTINTQDLTTFNLSNLQNLYYTPYQEFVQEIDPNHQYTPADEVLTVKGSEKITRDLKVQGFIYQDEYNRAVLPNINANTINSNGGVLTIGDLD